jgi:DNA-binding FadR family transcriptional regulator
VTVIDFFETAVNSEELPTHLDERNVEVHRELVDAITSQDPKRLRSAMRAHDRHRRLFGLGRITEVRG